MSRVFPHWRVWLANAWHELRWVILIVCLVTLMALFEQPPEVRLRLLPIVVAIVAVTCLGVLAMHVLIAAIWEGSPLWPRTSRVIRRTGALIFVPMVVLCAKGAIAQWGTDRTRGVLAGCLALAFCWLATMVALDRTWKGSRRE